MLLSFALLAAGFAAACYWNSQPECAFVAGQVSDGQLAYDAAVACEANNL